MYPEIWIFIFVLLVVCIYVFVEHTTRETKTQVLMGAAFGALMALMLIFIRT